MKTIIVYMTAEDSMPPSRVLDAVKAASEALEEACACQHEEGASCDFHVISHKTFGHSEDEFIHHEVRKIEDE